jgi:acyl dehydratase
MRIPFRHEVVGFQSMVNYGSNKLRFPSPVPVGSEVHARARVAAVEALAKGTQVTLEMQTFVKGFDRPSVINEIVVLYM